MSAQKKIRTAVLGASGYTGAELLRFVLRHPAVEIVALTAEKNAGQPVGAILPQLAFEKLPPLIKTGEVNWNNVDLAFCCLPHGTTQTVVASIPENVRVIDLSADFRLADIASYQKWYGNAHAAPELQESAVYGITEIARDKIKNARLVANPGCYPTSAILPLYPLLKDKLIAAEDIIIDSKSGVTGAGREARLGSLYAEVAEGIHAYGIANHRHTAEIEQSLSLGAGQKVTVNFTPHLMPMNRGILSTIYVKLAHGKTAADLRAKFESFYRDAAFVKVAEEGISPATRHVRGSNYCVMNAFADRLPGRAIIVSVEDNLVKGASGQAIQNMNVMFDLPETTGIDALPMFP
jgi:N-acetyl-gamma-glutamyl-phosphate reductase